MLGAFSGLTEHRALTKELTRREILGRYRGSHFGLLWTLISPFLMLCVYTFAFGTVMRGHWAQAERGNASFAIIVFAGLIVHGFFAECFNRAPSLMLSNANFVKKVVFPLEILPWSMAFSALFHLATNLAVFVLLRLALDGDFDWHIVFFPLVILPLFLMVLGVSWVLASLGVYLRDIAQVVGVVAVALLFLSSALVPLDTVPSSYRWVFELNPLTFVIDQTRAVVLWGELPDWFGLAKFSLASLAIFFGGHAWFMVTKKGFADVL